MKHGNLHEMAQLNYLDLVSCITAAACHDFAHDGWTNSCHVNFVSDRALRYHDLAVQENYHAAESLKILRKPENHFLADVSKDERKLMRKRMIGLILATDCADHEPQLKVLSSIVKSKGITKEKNNGQLLIDSSEDPTEKFKSQQMIMNFCIHACDFSTPTRKFDTCKEWTYLLFEEFFLQGDAEKA